MRYHGFTDSLELWQNPHAFGPSNSQCLAYAVSLVLPKFQQRLARCTAWRWESLATSQAWRQNEVQSSFRYGNLPASDPGLLSFIQLNTCRLVCLCLKRGSVVRKPHLWKTSWQSCRGTNNPAIIIHLLS